MQLEIEFEDYLGMYGTLHLDVNVYLTKDPFTAHGTSGHLTNFNQTETTCRIYHACMEVDQIGDKETETQLFSITPEIVYSIISQDAIIDLALEQL